MLRVKLTYSKLPLRDGDCVVVIAPGPGGRAIEAARWAGAEEFGQDHLQGEKTHLILASFPVLLSAVARSCSLSLVVALVVVVVLVVVVAVFVLVSASVIDEV